MNSLKLTLYGPGDSEQEITVHFTYEMETQSVAVVDHLVIDEELLIEPGDDYEDITNAISAYLKVKQVRIECEIVYPVRKERHQFIQI